MIAMTGGLPLCFVSPLRRRVRRALGVLAVGLVLWLGAVGVEAYLPQTFVTNGAASQVARFIAHYSTGPVEGRIQPVEGSLTFDPARLDSGLTGAFSVDVENLDTGLGLRDRALRNEYLETHLYDRAEFAFHRAAPRNWEEDGGIIRFDLDGELTFHGVTRTESVAATLTPTEAGYNGVIRFEIVLSDYDIEPPTWLFLTVRDLVQITVLLTLTPQG
ncbi:MAG: YceI family protein [Bacteroidetes bacterium]|nr:MAG: YceI family protein [Bacteroidota bacterium]